MHCNLLNVQVEGSFTGASRSPDALYFGTRPGPVSELTSLAVPEKGLQQEQQTSVGQQHFTAATRQDIAEETLLPPAITSSAQSEALDSQPGSDEEPEDDRANDPACIQCDDGGKSITSSS